MIDLDRELLELFNKERMIAFFDYQVPQGEAPPLSGLCKISQPKSGTRQSRYVSLLFLMDTPDDVARQQVEAYVGWLDWNTFQHELRGVETVLPIPQVHKGSGIYLKEVDIYLDSGVSIVKQFVLNQLYPAILRVMRIRGGELVFWDDVTENRQGLQDLALEKESNRSIVERLKDFFQR